MCSSDLQCLEIGAGDGVLSAFDPDELGRGPFQLAGHVLLRQAVVLPQSDEFGPEKRALDDRPLVTGHLNRSLYVVDATSLHAIWQPATLRDTSRHRAT